MTDLAMKSRLFECSVAHQRLLPSGHRFEHGVFMLYLELGELSCLAQHSRLFNHNSFNLFSFYDSDHLFGTEPVGADSSLLTRLGRLVADHGICEPMGKAYLLTYPRVLGYVFNPVSFYFVFDRHDQPLACIAEVGNTFGEMKIYFMDATKMSSASVFDAIFTKYFYVSPFGKLQDKFHFVLPLPNQALKLSVDTVDGEDPSKKILVTSVSGDALPLTDRQLLRLFFRYPLVTLRVISLIHWHALLLWLKKIPFFFKEQWPELQTDSVKRVNHER